MKKYNFNLNILKKNFNFKNFCEELDYLVGLRYENWDLYKEQVGIYKYLIYFSFYQKVPLLNTVMEADDTSEFGKDYHIIDKEFGSKKNSKIREEIITKIADGSIFEFFNDNFKLIYHFPMNCFVASLIYSKFNKTYYHIAFHPFDLKKKKDFDYSLHHVIDFYDKKISEKVFFNDILKYYREDVLGFNDGKLIKGRDEHEFQDLYNKKVNYWRKIAYDNFDK